MGPETIVTIAKKFTRSSFDARSVRRLLREQQEVDGKGGVWSQGQRYQLFSLTGFGKSGTNWLGSLLNLHSGVNCKGEFNFHLFAHALDQFTQSAGHIGRHEPFRSVTEESLQVLYARVLLCLAAEKPGATHLGDRTPQQLSQIILGAPVLWIVRDCRDVIVSYTYHYLRLQPKFNIQHWTPEIRELFWSYAPRYHASPPDSCRSVAAELLTNSEWVSFIARMWGRRYQLDSEAAQTLAGRCLRVRYEDLHADTAREMARVYRFLELDPGLSEPISSDSLTAPGFGREDPLSFYRKGVPGDWRSYTNDAFELAVAEHAGTSMAMAGYG